MRSALIRLSVVLLILVTVVSPAQAGFKDTLETPAPIHGKAALSRLTAVARAGASLIAVGPLGRIVISKDGGASWQQVPVPVSSDLVAVRFLDAQNGWAVGHDGVVLHSRDGGATWVKQLDGIQAIKAMATYYQAQGESAGTDSKKLSEDVRRFVEEGADKPFFDVLFVNANDGFVVGAFNFAFFTKDGGQSWVPMIDRTANPTGSHLYSLAASKGGIYIAGERGLLRHWDRENERFVPVDSSYQGTFFGIVANDSGLVAFGLRGNAVRSTDGGQTWKALQTGTTAGLTAGTVMPDGRVLLATKDGGLLMSDARGDGFIQMKVARAMPYFGVAPAGTDKVVLVGAGGVRVESTARPFLERQYELQHSAR
jgi:photosystem II stability/assembly factor-like uncharacterized protein